MKNKLYRSAGMFNRKWYRYSGQKRCPKKGEYFLSGAIPEVYLATNDLTTEYHIMTEVPSPPQTIEQNGLTYQLENL